MEYQRRGKSQKKWTPEDPERMIRILSNTYTDIALAMKQLEKGSVLSSMFAYYRRKPVSNKK